VILGYGIIRIWAGTWLRFGAWIGVSGWIFEGPLSLLLLAIGVVLVWAGTTFDARSTWLRRHDSNKSFL